jgi:multicomponent Na+:H+ antiporter subunit A
MSSPFAPAPAVLATLFALSVLAPWLAGRLHRAALPLLAVPMAGAAIWFATMMPALARGADYRSELAWVPGLGLTLDLRLDALAGVMCLVITVIGTLVLIYSTRYFPADDDGLAKYAGSLLAFAAAMLGLVLADNLILLVIFWELTGILSYLLIAHRVRKQTSRSAASQALMVTTAGGLAMLVGAVLLGVHAGTYSISAILADPPGGSVTVTAVVLLAVGGISKSAIVPFHFWLPGAMAAPTPASAYLHAATMVKAGIYLFARFAPAFAALGFWRPGLIALGAVTMLAAGAAALRQRDLKLLLAYGTVSQLGLLTMFVGSGNPDALLAGAAMLIGHATFKGALFFVVGIVDTATGTRNLTELSGLGRRMPVVTTLAVLSALSMAGLPPMVGFVAKEAGYAGLLAGGTAGTGAAVVAAAGSVLTVAYSARFCWGAFATKAGVPQTAPGPRTSWMTVPTALLVAAGLLLGLAPAPLDHLLQASAATAGGAHPGALALWHGWTLPLLMSAIALVGGLAVYAAQRAVEDRRGRTAAPSPRAGAGYRAVTAGTDVVAARVTAGTQRGSLPVSLGAILVVLVAFPGWALITSGARPGPLVVTAQPAQAVLAVVVMVLALTVLRTRRALAAFLTTGGVGYAIAVLYVLRGAPDLALTQILVETVTLVAAVLVIVRMPDGALSSPGTSVMARGVRIALAVCVGSLMTALALVIPGQRRAQEVSADLASQVLEHGGHNEVNVILVDVRGWDTFGEISVLVAAAVGVSSLIFLRSPRPARRERSAMPDVPVAPNPSPWLVTDSVGRRSLLLEVATRLVFHLIVIFSLYVLFVGHDEPGGGFAAGLIAGIALTLRYLAGGRYELAAAAPVDAGTVMGLGLVVAGLSAASGLVFGDAALTSTVWQATLPVVGHLQFVTSSVFDIGVYLVVVGVVLEVLRSLGAELDRQAAAARPRSAGVAP